MQNVHEERFALLNIYDGHFAGAPNMIDDGRWRPLSEERRAPRRRIVSFVIVTDGVDVQLTDRQRTALGGGL
jgi:hypothetical protein